LLANKYNLNHYCLSSLGTSTASVAGGEVRRKTKVKSKTALFFC